MEHAGKVSRVVLNHMSMIGFVLGQTFGWNLQLTVSTDDSKSCKSILLELQTQFNFIYLDYFLCSRARSVVKFIFICTKTILFLGGKTLAEGNLLATWGRHNIQKHNV